MTCKNSGDAPYEPCQKNQNETSIHCQGFLTSNTNNQFSMSVTSVFCHYCSAECQLQSTEVTTTDKITLKLIEHDVSERMVIPERTVNCPFCGRKYEFINFPNFQWVKNKLIPTNTMLEAFNIIFPDSTLDMIYPNIIGITKPNLPLVKRVLRHKHYHICFKLNDVRAYVDCQEARYNGKNILQGLNIYEV